MTCLYLQVCPGWKRWWPVLVGWVSPWRLRWWYLLILSSTQRLSGKIISELSISWFVQTHNEQPNFQNVRYMLYKLLTFSLSTIKNAPLCSQKSCSGPCCWNDLFFCLSVGTWECPFVPLFVMLEESWRRSWSTDWPSSGSSCRSSSLVGFIKAAHSWIPHAEIQCSRSSASSTGLDPFGASNEIVLLSSHSRSVTFYLTVKLYSKICCTVRSIMCFAVQGLWLSWLVV